MANGPEQSSTYSPPQLKVGERLILGSFLIIWRRLQSQSYSAGSASGATRCAVCWPRAVTNHGGQGSREMVIFLIRAFQRKGGCGELMLPKACVREAERTLSAETHLVQKKIHSGRFGHKDPEFITASDNNGFTCYCALNWTWEFKKAFKIIRPSQILNNRGWASPCYKIEYQDSSTLKLKVEPSIAQNS